MVCVYHSEEVLLSSFSFMRQPRHREVDWLTQSLTDQGTVFDCFGDSTTQTLLCS